MYYKDYGSIKTHFSFNKEKYKMENGMVVFKIVETHVYCNIISDYHQLPRTFYIYIYMLFAPKMYIL